MAEKDRTIPYTIKIVSDAPGYPKAYYQGVPMDLPIKRREQPPPEITEVWKCGNCKWAYLWRGMNRCNMCRMEVRWAFPGAYETMKSVRDGLPNRLAMPLSVPDPLASRIREEAEERDVSIASVLLEWITDADRERHRGTDALLLELEAANREIDRLHGQVAQLEKDAEALRAELARGGEIQEEGGVIIL